MDLEKYWLDTYANEASRRVMKIQFQRVKEWIGKPVEEMVEERRQDLKSDDLITRQRYEKTFFDMYNHYCKITSVNNAKSVLTAARAFFTTMGTPLVMKPFLRKAAKKRGVKKSKHLFTKEELQKMYQVGNILEKTILILGIQTGLSPIDLVNLRVEKLLPFLKMDPPVGIIEMQRRKTDVTFPMILGRDSVETLKLYLGTRKKGWLFLGYKGGHLNRDEPNIHVQKMARDANINPRGTIIYYCLREYFKGRATHGGMSERTAEWLMGHTMRYGGAYDHKHDFELLEEYTKAEDQISILNQVSNHNRIEILERMLKTRELEITRLNQEVGLLKKGLMVNLPMIPKLQAQLEQAHHLFADAIDKVDPSLKELTKKLRIPGEMNAEKLKKNIDAFLKGLEELEKIKQQIPR